MAFPSVIGDTSSIRTCQLLSEEHLDERIYVELLQIWRVRGKQIKGVDEMAYAFP
jgi:hypothetical protein